MAAQLVGRTFAADLGQLQARLTYESDTQMTFTVVSGAGMTTDGHTETVDVEIVEIRPQVYLVSWREASGATVVHVEDLATSTLHSTVTLDGQLYRLAGTFKEVDMSNKDTLLTAMRELFHDKDVTALDRYWAEPYIQHSPNLPNGLDGLRAAVPALEGFRWTPERVFEDGDYVIAHSRVSGWIPDGDAAIVDIFRFENGRIVEHWDVVQPYVEADQTTSGNPMV